jgi:cytochrome c oxidase subunit 2
MAAKLTAAVPATLVLLLCWAGSALAAPGGLGPPTPQTPSGEAISDIYWVVLTVCAIVFVLVETTLVLFIIRFRRRRSTPESAEGPQIHGNTRLEVIWTVIPAVILMALAIFTFTRIPAVQARGVEKDNPIVVKVQAHQFYWQYVYPNGAISLDDLYLPVDKPVELQLSALDVIHSWWVPALTGKQDAIPGRVNYLRFVPETIGQYDGKCAELCGIQHAVMATTVNVVSQDDYDSWLQSHQGTEGLGEATWNAVCAKCHGMNGQGDIGPAIAGNGTLTNPEGLRTLLLNGQNTPQFESYMPAVAIGWPDRQFTALMDYIKSSKTLSTAPAPTTTGGGG